MEAPVHIVFAGESDNDSALLNHASLMISDQVLFHRFREVQKLIDECNTNANAIPDIIFLDFKIPRRRSLEHLKQLRECDLFRDTVMVIYSDFSSPAMIDQCYYYGADFYLRKTTNEKHLSTFIQSLLSMLDQNLHRNADKSRFLVKL